jgi:glucose dehydrogenase
MKNLVRRILPLALGLLLLMAGCTNGAATTTNTTPVSTTPPETTTPTATTPTATTPTTAPVIITAQPGMPGEAIPPEVSLYAADWPLAGKNYANTRATTDSTINSQNINQLGVAWTIPIKGSAISTVPIVMGNTVYFQDRDYNIYCANMADGSLNWMNSANTSWIGPNGVAVGWGKVFAPLNWYTMGALDATTGKEIWGVELSSQKDIPYLYINIQPIPYNNMVYASNSPHVAFNSSGGITGWIYAFDQQSGVIDWAFNTVLSDNFWGHPELNSGGGCWQPCAVDTETGITYWGVANPGNATGPNGPYVGGQEGQMLYKNGESRPGPNLYTNCLIALDGQSGYLEWFNSAFPHDIYDHDLMNPPILASANIMGAQRDIVIASGKGGIVFAYDRVTGATIWETPVGKHQNDHLAYLPDNPTVEVYPGVLGGVETPMAYADGVVFAPYDDLWGHYTSTGLAGIQPIGEGTGGMAAIDVATGEIKWDHKLPSLVLGGATVVNDLVITSTYGDNMIRALDKDTGDEVWTYKAPAGINAWPAVSNDTIVWPCGVGSNPLVLALRLGAMGTVTPPPTTTTPPPTTSPPTTTPPTTTSSATFQSLAASGKTTYGNICSACHGVNGAGTDVGPALWGSGATLGKYGGNTLFVDAQGMLQFISTKMPLNAPGSLTHQQYIELLAYILTQDNMVSPATAFSESQLGGIQIK